jgi:hypothetical protein
METPYYTGDYLSDSARGLRSGAYYSSAASLVSSYRYNIARDPYYESPNFGFRVASVPEPCSLALLFLGGWVLAKLKRSV